jgi:membrane fusion protein (multidrug efflux system)
LTREPVFEVVPASIEARETTVVAARLLARIEAIEVRAGDYVETGQLLIQLQQDELEARAGQAEQGVRSLQARLVEARRPCPDRGAARAPARRRRPARHGARQYAEPGSRPCGGAPAPRRGAHGAGLRQIRSPLDGRIVDRFAEPGDTVSPGQKILSLYNPFSLRVEAWVRESLALQLSEEQSLTVLIPALDRELQARIEEIVPAADPGLALVPHQGDPERRTGAAAGHVRAHRGAGGRTRTAPGRRRTDCDLRKRCPHALTGGQYLSRRSVCRARRPPARRL